MRRIGILSLLAILVSTVGLSQSKLGFEFAYNGYSNSVSVPRLMSYVTSMASGSGTSTYYGLTLTASEKITLRSGVAFWNMPFSPTVKGTAGGQTTTANETGTLSYSGMYFRIDRTMPYFFFTGGFDWSFTTSFQGSYTAVSGTGITTTKSGNDESILTDDFNNQFNLVFGLGPAIPIGKHLMLRGHLSAVVVVRGIYDSGVTATNLIYINTGAPAPDDTDVDLHYFPFVSYGFSLQYTFAGRP
jgi:hypothetical protein